MSADQFRTLRDGYRAKVAQIATSHHLIRNNIPMTASAMKILSRYPCELRAAHELTHFFEARKDNFDPYFTEKHRFAQMRLVERLKNEFCGLGRRVLISTEAKSPSGIYDILIKVNGNDVEVIKGEERIIVEIKTGSSVSLDQLERYLLDEVTVVLCRVAFGHVTVLRPRDYIDLLSRGLADYIEKAERILKGQPALILGQDCVGCPVDCGYAKQCEPNAARTVAFNNDKFGADLEKYLKNLTPSIDGVVAAVLKELGEATSERTY